MAVSWLRTLLAARWAGAVAGDPGSYVRFVVGFDSELSWAWFRAALATGMVLTLTALWLVRSVRPNCVATRAAATQTEPLPDDAPTRQPASDPPLPREVWATETGRRFHRVAGCNGLRTDRRLTPCILCSR